MKTLAEGYYKLQLNRDQHRVLLMMRDGVLQWRFCNPQGDLMDGAKWHDFTGAEGLELTQDSVADAMFNSINDLHDQLNRWRDEGKKQKRNWQGVANVRLMIRLLNDAMEEAPAADMEKSRHKQF